MVYLWILFRISDGGNMLKNNAQRYIEESEVIERFGMCHQLSERKLASALNLSKSNVHRSLKIANLPRSIKEAAVKYNTEKWVLVKYARIKEKNLKARIKRRILSGQITKYSEIKHIITS